MKITRKTALLLAVTAIFLALFLCRFVARHSAASSYRVATSHSLRIPAVSSDRDPAPGLLPGERININTAPAVELERLPGISTRRAEDIVAWRRTHGWFRSPKDLARVPGIGSATVDNLLPYITVREE